MSIRCVLFIAACFGGAIAPAHAEQFYVKSQAEYFAAAKKVQAGDVIILAKGNWQDFEIVLTGKGTKDKPITLISEAPGKTVITGKSNLRIGGDYILVTGLVFLKGHSPTGEVISFRRTKDDLARNSRVTEVVIDGFSKPDRYDDDYWVGMYGGNNRFDHNFLAGKTNKGVTLAVRLDSEESRENGHRIDHNYFGARPVLGSNGGETMRIGTSAYSMFNSNSVVEDNYFENCDGEIEIISLKSGGNIVRRNVFDASRGAVTLRHGDGNLIERNIFFGRGKDHTGGIRVINRNQTVRDNYMEGLRGTGFASALTVMDGVPNSPVNRYVQVDNALIEHNSVLDSARITLGAGKSEERTAPPVNSRFTGNLLSGAGAGSFVEVDDDISGMAFTDNLVISGGVHSALATMPRAEVELARAANGLLYPVGEEYASLGAPRDLQPLRRADAGPDWYPKPGTTARFDTGKVIRAAPGEDSLSQALQESSSGDRIELAAGAYVSTRTMVIDHPVTVAGPEAPDRATISFTRPSLFEIADNGSLKLSNLTVSGRDAPDNVGNSVVRTSPGAIQHNFVVELDEVRVSNLNVNKSFDVIAIGKGALADRIAITRSSFENISGTVVKAASETDDYGHYNAEYVTIEDSTFAKIGDLVADIYRGGKDESTFGPHFLLARSSLTDVGTGSDNRLGASILLHGVQDTLIQNNNLVGSAPVEVIHTVGAPSTVIADNSFDQTGEPVIKELFYIGPPRAKISGSKISERQPL